MPPKKKVPPKKKTKSKDTGTTPKPYPGSGPQPPMR